MKKFIVIFFSIILFLVIGCAVFIFTFDINSYKSRIEKALNESTGYTFVINGQVKATRTLESIVNIEDVVIQSDQGFASNHLLKVKRMQLKLDLKSLMKDIVIIESIDLRDVDLNLEVNDKGQVNWSPTIKKKVTSKSKKPSLKKVTPQEQGKKQFSIATINALNVNVSYTNRLEDDSFKILLPQVSIQQLLNVSGKAVLNQETVDFSGTIRNLWTTIQKQKDLNFSFDFSSAPVKGKISGVCRDLKACKKYTTLNIDFTGSNLHRTLLMLSQSERQAMSSVTQVMPKVHIDEQSLELLTQSAFSGQSKIRIDEQSLLMEGNFVLAQDALSLSYNIEHNFVTETGNGKIDFDVKNPTLPQAFGLEPFSVKMNYTLENGQVLELSNINAMFNETDIDGSVRIVFEKGKKPEVVADLHSHYLKISNVLYLEEEQSAHAEASDKVFPVSQLNLGFLNAINGRASVSIDNLSVANMLARYPQVLLHAQLTDGVLTVNLDEGSFIAGGQVVGQAVFRDNADVADFNLSFVAQNLDFAQIVPWKKVLRSGNVNADVQVSTKGDSIASLMSNMNGHLLMSANEVDITSPLVKQLLPEDSSSSTSRTSQELFIKCAVINVPVQNGVVELAKNVAFETSKFNMIISGNINLKEENLSLQLIPYRNKFDKSIMTDMNQSVMFEGSFTDPKSKVIDRQISAEDTKKVQMSEKQALLTSYTKRQPVDESANSVCRLAMGSSVLRDIDAYFGREKFVETRTEEAPVVEEQKASKAEEIGRDLLESLSDVLSTHK